MLTKKDAQLESSKLSLIWGKVRTAAWDTAPQIALRDCSKETVGGRSIYKFPVKVEFNTIESEKKVLISQSCPTLSNPIDCSPSSSSVHGISQARILEWIVISFSSGSSWPLRTHFTKGFLLVTGSDATMKGLSAFLDMRKWNHWDHKIIFQNTQLSKELSHQIPWITECLTLFWTPSWGVARSTATAAQGSVSAGADGKDSCCLVVGKALGKCQIVADKTKFVAFKDIIVVI